MKSFVPVIFFSLTVCMSACKSKKDKIVHEPDPLVQITYPKQEKLAYTITASGSIASSQQIELSFKTGGMVEKIFVKEGDYVHKGQLLAQLNRTELDAQLAQSNLELNRYQRDIKRLNVLVRDTIVTLEQLQNMETAFATAKARKEAIAYNSSQSAIYAPAAGVVIKRQVSPGEFKPAGATALIIGSNDQNKRWFFKVSVSDRDRIRLQPGQKAQLTLDVLPDHSFEGTVAELATVPNKETLTYDCYFSFEPGNIAVMYGLSGKISLIHNSEELYTTLPLETLSDVNDQQAYIYTVSGSSTAVKRKVHMLRINKNEVLLQENLDAGTAVISTGKNKVEAGKKVKITNPS